MHLTSNITCEPVPSARLIRETKTIFNGTYIIDFPIFQSLFHYRISSLTNFIYDAGPKNHERRPVRTTRNVQPTVRSHSTIFASILYLVIEWANARCFTGLHLVGVNCSGSVPSIPLAPRCSRRSTQLQAALLWLRRFGSTFLLWIYLTYHST